jgi:hypothetical protein
MRSVHLLDSIHLEPFCGAASGEDGWTWTTSLAETSCSACRRLVAADGERLRRWNAQGLTRARVLPLASRARGHGAHLARRRVERSALAQTFVAMAAAFGFRSARRP